jgi:hypothetical protein
MFHLSTVGFSRSVGSLLEVLELFQNNGHFAFLDASEVSLSHAGQPLHVTKYDGRLSIRASGAMRDLFLSMLDEIDGAYFRPSGRLLEPWQIRREHWDLLFFAFQLSTQPFYLFSSDQVIAANEAGSATRTFSLFELCEAEARARFGFGYAGPAVAGSGQVNSRHEVHIAYALASGKPVPDEVVAYYARLAAPFASDVQWALPLLTVPALRGAMPVAKLRVLVSVLRHAGRLITPENAAVLAMVARLLPNEPTQVEVDNLLYRHGLLDARALPECYGQPVDIGAPVAPFAEVLRRVMADERQAASLGRLDIEHAEGRLSQREYELKRQMAILDHGRGTFEFANRFVTAIAQADMHLLLEVLDRPDDQNRWTKKAVREFYGVKLIGLKAAKRRRAIFALAGMDEARQVQWENRAAAKRDARVAQREAEWAKERAASARYRYGTSIISGAQHVEQSIANGFTEIVQHRHGASCRYALLNAQNKRELRTVRASDGTLAYAKTLLSQPSA